MGLNVPGLEARPRVLGLKAGGVGLDVPVLAARPRVLGLRSRGVGLDVSALVPRFWFNEKTSSFQILKQPNSYCEGVPVSVDHAFLEEYMFWIPSGEMR